MLLLFEAKFGQWHDLIISQLQAFFSSSFHHIPPSGDFCQVSELNILLTKWSAVAVDCLFGENWPKNS